LNAKTFQITSTVFDSAFHLREFTPDLIACALHLIQGATRNVELVAHLSKRPLETFNLGHHTLLYDVSFAIEVGAHIGELLLGLESGFARSALFGVRDGLSLLVGDRAKDIGDRDCQVGFELPVQRRAEAVEHRANLIVE
jgi:hypothetical protein